MKRYQCLLVAVLTVLSLTSCRNYEDHLGFTGKFYDEVQILFADGSPERILLGQKMIRKLTYDLSFLYKERAQFVAENRLKLTDHNGRSIYLVYGEGYIEYQGETYKVRDELKLTR